MERSAAQPEMSKEESETQPEMQVLDDRELGNFGRLRGAAADRLLPGLHNQRNRHAHSGTGS